MRNLLRRRVLYDIRNNRFSAAAACGLRTRMLALNLSGGIFEFVECVVLQGTRELVMPEHLHNEVRIGRLKRIDLSVSPKLTDRDERRQRLRLRTARWFCAPCVLRQKLARTAADRFSEARISSAFLCRDLGKCCCHVGVAHVCWQAQHLTKGACRVRPPLPQRWRPCGLHSHRTLGAFTCIMALPSAL